MDRGCTSCLTPRRCRRSPRSIPRRLRRLFGLLRAAFNTVVIDTSKGLQSSDFTAFEMSDVILVVVQLDLVCLRNTSRLIGLFRQFDGLAERVKLVANRSGSLESEISLKKAEETLKMPISWQIPNASRPFQDARIKGVPLAEVAKGSRAHQVFLEIARSLRPAGGKCSRRSPKEACSPPSSDRMTPRPPHGQPYPLKRGVDTDVARTGTQPVWTTGAAGVGARCFGGRTTAASRYRG